jgi:hypothetical protein
VPPGQSGTRLEAIHPAAATTVLDMDDDGTADTASGPVGGAVVVHRGDGDLTVEGIPTGPAPSAGVSGDDLDGDGRTELVVWRTQQVGSSTRRTTWIVPGTTPPGTVDVGTAGLSFEGEVTGDVTGDGLDDLARSVLASNTTFFLGWVSGAERLAVLGSPQPYNGLDVVGLRTDLDFDGQPDTVHLGSPLGGIAPKVVLSTGTTLGLDADAPALVSAYRSGSRTILQTSTFSAPTVVRGFDVHTACADAWMRSVTGQLMGRAPISADYPTFGPTSEPDRSQRLVRTTAMVRSQSARNLQITGWYDVYLERPADPVGRAYWLKGLRNGTQTPDAMAATLLGSREFLVKRTGGDPASWVRAVFPKVVGRTPDPSGLAYWTNQAAQLGPQRAAARLLASPEGRRFRIRTIHDSIFVLGGPQPAEVVSQGLAVYAAHGYDAFLADLLASDAVYLKAQRTNRLEPA